MRPSESIREQEFKSSEVDAKEMKIFRYMPGTLVKNPLPVQWKIHFPVPYEIRRHRAVSQWTHRSNSLEETILFSDIKKTNWNHIEGRRTFYVLSLWCCGQLPWGKWSVVMMSISWEAGGEQRGQEGAQNLPCSSPAAEPFAALPSTASLFHSCTTKIWGFMHLKTLLKPYDSSPFSKKSFFWAENTRKRIEGSIFKSGSLAAQGRTLIIGFNIELVKAEFCRQLKR